MACVVLLVLILSSSVHTACANVRPLEGRMLRLSSLSHVPALFYHGGALLTSPSLRLHLLWYGTFPASLQAAITDFISSFQAHSHIVLPPSVASWWSTVSLYTDASLATASPLLQLGAVSSIPSYSKGKRLTKALIATLLEDAISLGTLPYYNANASGITSIYAIFTADDVLVESFCRNSCGFHSTVMSGEIPFIWVGNAAKQCVGLCAWPFAVPQSGPPRPPLVPPSGSAATDGMIINLATLLAGIVTNPFGKGYFPNPINNSGGSSGDDNDMAGGGEVEAATTCVGMFGEGSYPGFPGRLLVDPASGASYNANGLNNRHFLLPAVWSPTSKSCVSLF